MLILCSLNRLKKIYLYLQQFLNNKITQVVEIIPNGGQDPT